MLNIVLFSIIRNTMPLVCTIAFHYHPRKKKHTHARARERERAQAHVCCLVQQKIKSVIIFPFPFLFECNFTQTKCQYNFASQSKQWMPPCTHTKTHKHNKQSLLQLKVQLNYIRTSFSANSVIHPVFFIHFCFIVVYLEFLCFHSFSISSSHHFLMTLFSMFHISLKIAFYLI